MANENEKILNTVIVLRHDTKTAWETDDAYVLCEGEVGIGYMIVEQRDENNELLAGTIDKYVPIIKVGTKDSAGEMISWKDLPQAEGVFEEDLTLTYNFGRYTTQNGKVIARNKGMTTSEWLKYALSKTINPYVNYPTAGFVTAGHTTNTGTNEIGSKITHLKYTLTAGLGSYTDKAGSTGTFGTTVAATSSNSGIGYGDFTWTISNSAAEAATTVTSTQNSKTYSMALPADSEITIDSTIANKEYATMTASVELNPKNARIPYNNVTTACPSLQIKGFNAGGTTTKTFTDTTSNNNKIKVSGYREGLFYGTVTTAVTAADLDGWDIRQLSKTGVGYKGFTDKDTTMAGTQFKFTVPAGAASVIIACPKDNTGVTNILNTTVNANMNEAFGLSNPAIISVGGADATADSVGDFAVDYNVWIYTPESGAYPDAADLTITLG